MVPAMTQPAGQGFTVTRMRIEIAKPQAGRVSDIADGTGRDPGAGQTFADPACPPTTRSRKSGTQAAIFRVALNHTLNAGPNTERITLV